MAPEASADRSDFRCRSPVIAIGDLSASFAGRNLHLVISAPAEIQPLVLRYSVGKSAGFYTGGRIPSSATPRRRCFHPASRWAPSSGGHKPAAPPPAKKVPRMCRVLRGFEPAFAGGLRPGNAALALAYRVVAERWKPFKWVLAQNVNAISRTLQGTNLIP